MLAEPELRREDRPTTGDGIVTGLGRIGGRKVAIIAIDDHRARRHHRAGQHAQAEPGRRVGRAARACR